MNTMAQEMPLFSETPAEEARPGQVQVQSQAQSQAPSQAHSLDERYRRAGQYERLCLWLQYRGARQELDQLEAESPFKPGAGPGRWRRLLGLLRL